MRILALLLITCLMAACASQPEVTTKEDCLIQEGNVWVTMRSASWLRRLGSDTEPAGNRTFVHLRYPNNLDPDPLAIQRAYAGVGEPTSLFVTFGDQFRRRPTRDDGYFVEVRSEGGSATRRLERSGQASFEGDDLSSIFAGPGDILLLLRDASGEVLREERIMRSDLTEMDALIRQLSAALPRMLADPERLCARPLF